ncbi:hypothetical protein LOD99_7002 [Oopsacas minuta]|uniref:BHLH domain-containing protein n=1 Tax=Oopsacas minuta TaxID=111878 RepID=A0AAV7JJ98_9METZ|nr:hypothetical protein LOD99_7002 [Oopsacas minuta]
MIHSRTKLNSKKGQSTSLKSKDNTAQISQKGRHGVRNLPLQQHAQIMREAKRLREQIRVRAVNGEYTHLNQTLGLKKQCKSLPKISKQQTLKTCIEHIKLLKAELSEVIDQPQEDQFRNSLPVPSMPRPSIYMPSFPIYIPNYYPQNEEIIETQHDDVMKYPEAHFPYISSYPEDNYETDMRTFHEEDSSISEIQINSENFDSDFSTDFPNYTDSFCSTPESRSSNFSWFISSDWANLHEN